MFGITEGKGFAITFSNGVIVSVQFGGGNYCANYGEWIGSELGKKYWSCIDAEVAAWKPEKAGQSWRDRVWITREYFHGEDDMQGHVSPDELLGFLNWAAAYQIAP